MAGRYTSAFPVSTLIALTEPFLGFTNAPVGQFIRAFRSAM